MGGDESAQRLGANQRCIAGQHDDQLGPAQRSARYLHGVPSTVLRLLQHDCSPGGLDDSQDLLGLMPHHDNCLFRAQRGAGAKDLFNQRPPARAVQHFREARLQPCALSSGEDDDS
jgi:hypothetical protein